MSLLQRLLHATNFSSPLLRTAVPSIGAAFAIQAAFAVPSILAQNESLYDFSGALTNISVVALSLYLPALRAKFAAGASAAAAAAPLPSLLAPFTNPAAAALNWRQVALTAAVTIWATRLGTFLFHRVLQAGTDSRFDEIKKSPPRFFAVWMVQGVWCSLITLPVVALNSVPAAALASRRVGIADVVGVALWVGGFALEVAADRQKSAWMREKREKKHSEEFMTRGLWQRSRFPNYFGESTLWTGIATVSAGALLAAPAQRAIGLSGGPGATIAALSLAFISPVFTTYVVTQLSGIPLSEKKYDKRYGDRKDYQEWKQNTPKFFPKIFA